MIRPENTGNEYDGPCVECVAIHAICVGCVVSGYIVTVVVTKR